MPSRTMTKGMLKEDGSGGAGATTYPAANVRAWKRKATSSSTCGRRSNTAVETQAAISSAQSAMPSASRPVGTRGPRGIASGGDGTGSITGPASTLRNTAAPFSQALAQQSYASDCHTGTAHNRAVAVCGPRAGDLVEARTID